MGQLGQALEAKGIRGTDCVFVERDGALRRAEVSKLSEHASLYDIVQVIVTDIQNTLKG